MDATELAARLHAALPDVLVALDFDGTLAPIVADPAASRPVAGTGAVLTALAGAGARIAIITGRDAATVLELSGLTDLPGLVVEGLYGAETWSDGVLHSPDEPPVIARLRAELPDVLATAHADPDVWIEDKRLSLVVHGRMADDPEAALRAVREPVAALAGQLGLELHPGRGVLELRLPGFDKAGALRRLLEGELFEAGGPRAVVFAGDDVGDLPAFELIRTLRAEGRAAWSVAVHSPDASEVSAAADVVVDEPAAVVALLGAITDDRPSD